MCGRIASTQSRQLCFGILLLSVFIMALPGCGDKASDPVEYFLSQPQITAPEKYRACAVMVNNYVRTKRSWPESDFNTSFDRVDFNSGHQVFSIAHIDTYQAPLGLGGIGSSFLIHADCAKMQIIGEYREQ